ncbi:replication-relaxation family protein [Nesterenkonia flava]|uniref:Replication-relaxation family protein n=1 Tax=Nesterenkonia flava TaxID=469799 RepID=A0ABU1FV17_9MICC|nr:replication-relaxation family protein [Nesterenkonia flava]MDR5712038.1 replication-relaxation family protein [Nesterenkonia flava]
MTAPNTQQLPDPLGYPLYGELLKRIVENQFATTNQLARLTARRYKNLATATRRTPIHLNRLVEHGYLLQMPQVIGGRKRGSGPKIWTATSKGNSAVTGKRKRPRKTERSAEFIAHTLAVTETRVLLTELARQDGLHALELTGEPAAWRDHLGPYGQKVTLKPDLHLYARAREREYYAFLEVDRATENPGRIIRQCWRYDAYYRSGLEQQSVGVFPVVIWICPNAKRADQLLRYLGEHTAPAAKGNDQKLIAEMFLVTTMGDLPDTIRTGLAPPPKGKRQ